MKVNSLIAKALLVVLVITGWVLYQSIEQNTALKAENTRLQAELDTAQQALLSVELQMGQLSAELEAVKKNSLKGVLRETNKVVVSGWEQLLNVVEDELNKAKETFGLNDNKPSVAPDNTVPDDKAGSTQSPVEPQGAEPKSIEPKSVEPEATPPVDDSLKRESTQNKTILESAIDAVNAALPNQVDKSAPVSSMGEAGVEAEVDSAALVPPQEVLAAPEAIPAQEKATNALKATPAPDTKPAVEAVIDGERT